MSARYGNPIKAAGAYTGIKAAGVCANADITISVLKNLAGDDVLAKYIGSETLPKDRFIRADDGDVAFSAITFTGGAAQFINGKS